MKLIDFGCALVVDDKEVVKDVAGSPYVLLALCCAVLCCAVLLLWCGGGVVGGVWPRALTFALALHA